MADDDSLIDVAAAIADGTALDWRALEATASTPEARDRIRRLELLAGIGRLKADLTYPRPDENRLHESILHPSGISRAELDASPAPVSWGPLTIVEKIGRGTFGDVYRAREPRLDRDVALKLLRHKDTVSSASSDVIEEARLMAKVRHPNVTTIYGAEKIDGRVGLWMEFIDGPTLENELKTRGPFSADDLRRVGEDVASALSAVHRAGLLHRDVKAHNVLRAADGRLMLTDFGTGRPLASGGQLIDELAGSPLYLAPEVLNGAPATAQSDLYGLGVLLYRLATGSFPVHGKTLEDLRDAHATGHRTRLHDVRPELPPSLVDTIDRALSSDPSARPATAEMFAAALAATPASSRLPTWVWPSVAAATAVVALALWLSLRGGSPTTSSPGSIEETVLIGGDAERVLGVSPNGRMVAYVDKDTGNLGVRDLTTSAVRLLTKSGSWEKASYVESAVFSRDGRRLAYGWTEVIKDDLRYEVRIIDVDRPVERPPLFVHPDADWVTPMDWSPDGQRLALAFERDLIGEIALLDVAGGSPHVIKSVDWRGVGNMAFSPDGRYLAYDATPNEDTAERDVFTISVDGSDTHAVVTGSGGDHVAGWPTDNALLIASNRRGPMGLWRQDMTNGAANGEPALLKSDIREEILGLTSDSRVFYRVVTRDQPIAVATVALGTGKVVAPLTTPTLSGLADFRKPSWSPDGVSFSYISSTSANAPSLPTQRVLSIQTGANGASRILPMKLARWYTSSWAKDGRSLLAFGLDYTRHVGIFLVDTSTGALSPVVVDHNDIYPWLPQWANDRRHFYYLRGPDAWTSSIDTEFVERELKSGFEHVVFRNRDLTRPDGTPAPPLRDWTVSPDGTRLAGLETNDQYHALWVLPFNSHTAREVYRVPANTCSVPITHFAMLWTPDSHALIANAGVACEPAKRELWVVPVVAGQAPYKLDIGSVRLRNEAPAISPDGRQVAFQTGDDPTYEIRALRYARTGR